MSDLDYKLRCPFCNEGLLFWGATGSWRKCPKCDNNLLGNEELWQELITTKNQLTVERTTHDILQEELKNLQKELADTKKKLDIAVDALENIGASYPRITDIAMQDKANKALDKINNKEEKEDIEFQTSQFVWHLLELVETASVKLQEKISTLIKENDSIFLENKLKKEEK